jgi:hypothetical protein
MANYRADLIEKIVEEQSHLLTAIVKISCRHLSSYFYAISAKCLKLTKIYLKMGT